MKRCFVNQVYSQQRKYLQFLIKQKLAIGATAAYQAVQGFWIAIGKSKELEKMWEKINAIPLTN